MDLKELTSSLSQRKQGLAYTMWKQAYLITLGVSDLLKDTKTKSSFPRTPEEASPELYPPKPSLKLKTKLNKKYNERS